MAAPARYLHLPSNILPTESMDHAGTNEVERGRRYLIAALAFLMLTSIGTTLMYMRRRGNDQLPQQIGRLVVLAVVGYFLIQGRSWARWLLLALVLVALGLASSFFLNPGTFDRDRLRATLPVLAMYFGYAVVAVILVLVPSVRAVFRSRR
jgi:hypothetical protein